MAKKKADKAAKFEKVADKTGTGASTPKTTKPNGNARDANQDQGDGNNSGLDDLVDPIPDEKNDSPGASGEASALAHTAGTTKNLFGAGDDVSILATQRRRG